MTLNNDRLIPFYDLEETRSYLKEYYLLIDDYLTSGSAEDKNENIAQQGGDLTQRIGLQTRDEVGDLSRGLLTV